MGEGERGGGKFGTVIIVCNGFVSWSTSGYSEAYNGSVEGGFRALADGNSTLKYCIDVAQN